MGVSRIIELSISFILQGIISVFRKRSVRVLSPVLPQHTFDKTDPHAGTSVISLTQTDPIPIMSSPPKGA